MAFEDSAYVANTAFIILCAALVGLMTPGLAFFYGGLVRKTTVLTMMMQNMVVMGCIFALWFILGFSLSFGEDIGGAGFLGNPATFAFLRDLDEEPMTLPDGEVFVDTIPGLLLALYQGQFAVITPALMTGAFADRMRFTPYLLFVALWSLVVYAPWCHAVWGPEGWAADWGVVDFAGGIVVHCTAGFSALATVVVLGDRQLITERHETMKKIKVPHNVPFVALGTGLLWFGWFGFNGGSALAANGTAVYAVMNTEIAGAVAVCVWMLLEWRHVGKPSLVGVCVGAIAGLATITPASGFVEPWAAFVIGAIASLVCYAMVQVVTVKFDDALDVVGVHGVGGFLGTVLIGAFADDSANPGMGINASWEQFGKQLAVAVTCAVYSFVAAYLLLRGIGVFLPLLPKEKHLRQGLDKSFHGLWAYADEEDGADEERVTRMGSGARKAMDVSEPGSRVGWGDVSDPDSRVSAGFEAEGGHEDGHGSVDEEAKAPPVVSATVPSSSAAVAQKA